MREKLDETKTQRMVNDEFAVKINILQREFVIRHERQLVTHSHDLTTTREIIQRLLEDPMDGGALSIFAENQDRLLKQISHVLNHRDALYHEREKCMKMLGVEDMRIPLDEVISQGTGLKVNAHMEAEDKDEMIKRFSKQVMELESQLEVYEAGIVEFQKQVDDRDREISKLRHMVKI